MYLNHIKTTTQPCHLGKITDLCSAGSGAGTELQKS